MSDLCNQLQTLALIVICYIQKFHFVVETSKTHANSCYKLAVFLLCP